MAKNKYHQTIQETLAHYETALDGYDYEEAALLPESMQLDGALSTLTQTAALKIIHPLFIRYYRERNMHYRDEPLQTVGLDIETDAETGAPKLLGFAFEAPRQHYVSYYNPTIENLYEVVETLAESGQHLVVWGRFDLQILMRLFDPDENERSALSRGISANVKERQYPICRAIRNRDFFISSYISGRALKLGINNNDYVSTVWVFNISQFYPGTIEQTAKALKFNWKTFAKNTHIVDWNRFEKQPIYRSNVKLSNRQDAFAVNYFVKRLNETFYATFAAYPKLLVSTGSLTDAAVSKMLSVEDYNANSFTWLVRNVWSETETDIETVRFLEPLLSETFSAGYVDQFAMGYFNKVCTADISAAYPHKIRQLYDLRYTRLIYGESIDHLGAILDNREVETVFFRGLVHIPDSLHFHPITIKTGNRQNYRPTGTFWASYTLEERQFCASYGASFEHEKFVAIVLEQKEISPLAQISTKLGEMRATLLAQMKEANGAQYRFLDGQQYVVKVIDNSAYGKTVMTTEVVESIDGSPEITGYVAGDRFNMIWGCVITARTRVQIAKACMDIERNGGRPIMAMTDSVYWLGSPFMLPQSVIAQEKTPGYFEPPKEITEFYLIKTGQYEYKEKGEWHYRLRGLPVDSDIVEGRFYPKATDKGRTSLFRRQIKEQTAHQFKRKHPKDVHVTVDVKRLMSIGQRNLDIVGKIVEGKTDLQPFVLSSKQVDGRYIMDWPNAIDGHVWLDIPTIREDDSSVQQAPLFFLKEEYERSVNEVDQKQTQHKRSQMKVKSDRRYWRKKLFIYKAVLATDKPPPHDWRHKSWKQLETYFGISKEIIKNDNGTEQFKLAQSQ